MADVDLERLVCDRMRATSFTDAATDHRDTFRSWRHIELDLHLPTEEIQLDREVPRFPYVPTDPARRNERCAEVHRIQVEGLLTRLAATGIDKVVMEFPGARLHPGLGRRGQSYGPPRPAAGQRARRHDARLRHHEADAHQRPPAHGRP